MGRNEWCHLPALNIPAIKAKIDTGARTSAIHAFDIHAKTMHHKKYVYFKVHPIQGDVKIVVDCHAPIIDERYVMSSNGHKEFRYIIMTELMLSEHRSMIELSLSNRDPLTYRMLLGREALNKRMVVDTSLSCHQKKYKKTALQNLYRDHEQFYIAKK